MKWMLVPSLNMPIRLNFLKWSIPMCIRLVFRPSARASLMVHVSSSLFKGGVHQFPSSPSVTPAY